MNIRPRKIEKNAWNTVHGSIKFNFVSVFFGAYSIKLKVF